MIKNLNNTEDKNSRAGSSYGLPMPFSVTAFAKSKMIYQIHLFGDIEDTTQFSDAISAFNLANEDDEVTVLVNSNGGSISASQSFISEMQACKAPVHVS